MSGTQGSRLQCLWVDAVYGHPKPVGFVVGFGAAGFVVLLVVAYLWGGLTAAEVVQGEAVPSVLPLAHLLGGVFGTIVTLLVSVALVVGYGAFVRSRWMTRKFYRRMYGSYYDDA